MLEIFQLLLLATHSWKERSDRDPNKHHQLTGICDTAFLKGIIRTITGKNSNNKNGPFYRTTITCFQKIELTYIYLFLILVIKKPN